MGILNVTPDSFSDGGKHLDMGCAIDHGIRMWEAGATIIDVGGESTRPGADAVSESAEMDRVIPVIEKLHHHRPQGLISIDTSKAAVAREACRVGATIINDVTGLRGDPGMIDTVAQTGAGVVIMHMKGTPRTMQRAPQYRDVGEEIRAFFGAQLRLCQQAGVQEEQIVWDPGIGFGKTLTHNLEILQSLASFQVAQRPVLIGVSRKSLFQTLLNADVDDRMWATIAVTAEARRQGVRIHRVHDVEPNLEALRMIEAIYGSGNGLRIDGCGQ